MKIRKLDIGHELRLIIYVVLFFSVIFFSIFYFGGYNECNDDCYFEIGKNQCGSLEYNHIAIYSIDYCDFTCTDYLKINSSSRKSFDNIPEIECYVYTNDDELKCCNHYKKFKLINNTEVLVKGLIFKE